MPERRTTMKTIYDHQLYEVSESTDGRFFVKTGNKQIYTVGVEYPEHMNEYVRTFKCSCKGDGLCKHAQAVIEYLEGLDEADEVVLALRKAVDIYLSTHPADNGKVCR
jgi:hypothetical protein